MAGYRMADCLNLLLKSMAEQVACLSEYCYFPPPLVLDEIAISNPEIEELLDHKFKVYKFFF